MIHDQLAFPDAINEGFEACQPFIFYHIELISLFVMGVRGREMDNPEIPMFREVLALFTVLV